MPAAVHVIEAPFSNGTVPLELHLLEGDRVAVVDAGTAATPAEHLIPEVDGLGLEPDLLLVTHAHEDHVGGAEPLRRRFPRLQVALHRDDVAWAESVSTFWNETYLAHPEAWRPPPEQEAAVLATFGDGARVDRLLDDGERIDGTELTAVHAPSHSPGHLAYWHEQSGSLFVGDATQSRGVPLRQGPAVFPMYRDVPSYLSTIDRLEALEPEVVYTSHLGARRGAEARTLFAGSRSFVHEVHDVFNGLLTGTPQTLGELAARLHAAYPEYLLQMQFYVTTSAHLQEHERVGTARVVAGDGTRRWLRA